MQYHMFIVRANENLNHTDNGLCDVRGWIVWSLELICIANEP